LIATQHEQRLFQDVHPSYEDFSSYLLNHPDEIFQQLLVVSLTPPPIGYHGSREIAQDVRTHRLYRIQVP